MIYAITDGLGFVAVSLGAWWATRGVRAGRIRVAVYLLCTAMATLSLATVLGAVWLPNAAVPLALSTGAALLVTLLLTRVPAAHRWAVGLSWVVLSLLATISTLVLALRFQDALGLAIAHSSHAALPVTLVVVFSALAWIVGFPTIVSYTVGPLVAVRGKRGGSSGTAALGFVLGAHRRTGLPCLDVRREAMTILAARGDHRRAGAIAEELGEHGAALEEYQKAGDLAGEARSLLALGQWQGAAAKFESAVRPVDAACAYERGGEFRKAAGLVRVHGSPEEYERICRAGNLLLELASYLEENGSELQAAETYCEAGESGRAAPLYEKCGQHAKAGAAYLAAGDLPKAEDAFKQAGGLPGFYRGLRLAGNTSALEALKRRLCEDFTQARGLDSAGNASQGRAAYLSLLDRFELLSVDSPDDAELARVIGWSAVAFFERQKPLSLPDVRRAVGDVASLRGRGLVLLPLEDVALRGREMVIASAERRAPEAERHFREIERALDGPGGPALAEGAKEMLAGMLAQTAKLFEAQGNLYLARQLRGRAARLPSAPTP
jgi:tetratricopeptide (TPR) repeat protein